MDVFSIYRKLFFDKVKESDLIVYYSNETYRKCYKLMQAIAFLPTSDIVDGFKYLSEFVKTNCPIFERVLEYFERTYIGSLVKNSQTIRKLPRFAHKTCSLHESWQNSIRDSDRVDRQFVKLIEVFRVEQSNAENYLIKVKAGHEHKKNINKKKKTLL